MKLTRRKFIAGITAGAGLLLPRSKTVSAFQLKPKPTRPNVIFILADDLGWGDLSCYGRPDYKTPNLDRLAAQGVRFTDAYSASAVCTPTRCGFITGRYPARLKIGLLEPLPATNHQVGLDPQHPTVASLLKGSGYETALLGKWHLGFRPEWGPNAHGFDEFFGILAGAGDYHQHKNGLGEPDLYENLTPVEKNGYLTDLLTQRAVDYIKRRRTAPFYLSLHYTAPHWPWQDRKGGERVVFNKNTIEPRAMSRGGSLKLYTEMMRSLDEGVGEVMRALKSAGLERNTLVIFTSDNGGERFSYQWPFSGEKGELLEGGIRVPAIVRWPTIIPPKRITSQMAISMDWTATILAAANTPADPGHALDGTDLLPIIKGASPVHDRTFFWRIYDQDAVRQGKWKYVRTGTQRQLFDLSVDQREKSDFSLTNPDVLERLTAEFDKWNRQMLPRMPTRT
ncbi:MAG TPA: sulfatase-like hydrolase/transferase [Pyrinomonadaceae bacterium]|nr:sulfatase-like hydrolase/transferase [Pyrinomonadaceae bacterium]